MIRTERMEILRATEADIDTIIALESHPDNRDYLWIGTRQEHLNEIADPNHLLLVFKALEGGATIGYALARLDFVSERFELRRIAIEPKGLGYGREAMQALLAHAFGPLRMNKLWLDVYPHNTVGIRLYESLGMHRDGVLRENYKSATHGYLDQIIYSLLRREYSPSPRPDSPI